MADAKRCRAHAMRMLATVALALAAIGNYAPSASAASCDGTLKPVAAATGDAAFTVTCSVALPDQYELEAATSTGEPLDGTPHGLGQGFACADDSDLEGLAEDDESEGEGDTGPAASWVCTSGAEEVGDTISGSFATNVDPCASGLSLWIVFYETAGDLTWPLIRTSLAIDCPGGGAPPASGGGYAGAPAPPISRARLRIGALRLSRTTLDPTAGRGTRVSYTLSARARTRFAVERLTPGVRSHGRCVTYRGRAKRRSISRRCTFPVEVGAFARDGAAGLNSFRFGGRLARHKLPAGRYVLLATARAAGSMQSETVMSPRFSVVG